MDVYVNCMTVHVCCIYVELFCVITGMSAIKDALFWFVLCLSSFYFSMFSVFDSLCFLIVAILEYLFCYFQLSHLSTYNPIFYTIELQWLEHLWLVYHSYFELVLESIGKNPLAADLG